MAIFFSVSQPDGLQIEQGTDKKEQIKDIDIEYYKEGQQS